MLTLHLEAKNYEDLRTQVSALFPIIQPPAHADSKPESFPERQPMAAETAAKTVAETPAPVEAPVAKRAPGRPKKEAEPAAKVADPLEQALATFTLEQVRGALQAYATSQPDQTVGIVRVREVLATFKDTKGEPCQKISQVQPADYPALVETVRV